MLLCRFCHPPIPVNRLGDFTVAMKAWSKLDHMLKHLILYHLYSFPFSCPFHTIFSLFCAFSSLNSKISLYNAVLSQFAFCIIQKKQSYTVKAKICASFSKFALAKFFRSLAATLFFTNCVLYNLLFAKPAPVYR